MEYFVSDRLDQFRTQNEGFVWRDSDAVPDDQTSLVATDFLRVEPDDVTPGGQFFPGEHPDFSAPGGQVRVGFAAGTSTSDPMGRRTVFRVDDFAVTIQGVDPLPALRPAALALLAGAVGVAGLAGCRRRLPER